MKSTLAVGLGAGVAPLLVSVSPQSAFGEDDKVGALYRNTIPAEKGLSKEWIDSLTRRGAEMDAPIIGSSADDSLKYIGMPVGGIACGTVYLGGDGKLWIWDIFNQPHVGVVQQNVPTPDGWSGSRLQEQDGASYVNPPSPEAFPPPFRQGFGLRIDGSETRPLDSTGWKDIEFVNNWPIGIVEYSDPESPVQISLKAYSPFIPLDLNKSSLPVTIMEYTIENKGRKTVSASLEGWLENAALMYSRSSVPVSLISNFESSDEFALLSHGIGTRAARAAAERRPDLLVDDFEGDDYGEWKVEGVAFGDAPIAQSAVPAYQEQLAMQGRKAVNSHAAAPGGDIEMKDAATGRMTSPEFVIERDYINFLLGGGSHKGQTCVNLIVDGKIVSSATGRNSNVMVPTGFYVSRYAGKTARIEIVDDATGAWGNIGVDHIVQSDNPAALLKDIESLRDYGTMALALLGADGEQVEHDGIPGIASSFRLKRGESRKLVFVLAWHFPNTYIDGNRRHYFSRFEDASAVAEYVLENYARLSADTKLWVSTWYDTTLPNWLIERSILTANTLQTQNCYIFEDGRFWGWEGIGCCDGTCTHVWHYAQAVARLFPSIERNLREVTDYGMAQLPNGAVPFRITGHVAIDGQAGTVLRSYREHLMSADSEFLARNWDSIKRALMYLINFDRNDGKWDGLLDGEQHNTLDAEWFGKVHVLCSLYLAAVRAGEEMAIDMDDDQFRALCRQTYEMGSENMAQLYNEDYGYYIQIEDPAHDKAIGVGVGCYIDQVMGQFWAYQLNLGRLHNEEYIRSALQSLWRYNFVPDVGPFRQVFTRGRGYAVDGDAGLIMCTWPNGGLNPNFRNHWQYGYFNECMSGFEYQAAAHMVAERDPDLMRKGLAITRAVHDRYAPELRNPYNEIECSDHYARAMASYAVFLAACGFEYNGPEGYLAFDPLLSADEFKAPFTSAAGWGSLGQSRSRRGQSNSIEVKWGSLKLRRLEFGLPVDAKVARVKIVCDSRNIAADYSVEDGRIEIVLKKDLLLKESQVLDVALRY